MLRHLPIALGALAAALPFPASAADKRPTAPEVDPAAMVRFEASEFTMGVGDLPLAPYGQAWFVDQQPAHGVKLSAYSLDKREVTVAEFARFLSYAGGEAFFSPDQPIERVRGGYLPRDGADSEPIRQVTWSAADAYCRWAGKRLPTEAEWERAAAGTSGREYPWGDAGPGCDRAVFFTGYVFCERSVQPVGGRTNGATPEGIEDLAGNVAEWVADRYGAYGSAAVQDPTGPETGELRVVRGGGRLDNSLWLRTRARWGAAPGRRSEDIGFRCALGEPVQDGAVRGALDPIPDVERVASDRPLVAPVQLPEVLAEGLSRPGAVVRAGSRVFVLERGSGTVTELTAAGPKPLARGLAAPFDLASDGTTLYATEKDAGRVAAVDVATGEVRTLSDGESAPSQIAADPSGVVWAANGRIRTATAAGVATLGPAFTGIVAMSLAPDAVYVATDGGGDASKTAVTMVPRDGGAPVTLLGASTFAGGFMPSHVTRASDNSVWVLIRYRAFPYNGWIYRVDPALGTSTTVTFTPAPVGAPMIADGRYLYWGGRSQVLRIDREAPAGFETLGLWTWPGGLAIGDGTATWTDEHDGRAYRVRLP